MFYAVVSRREVIGKVGGETLPTYPNLIIASGEHIDSARKSESFMLAFGHGLLDNDIPNGIIYRDGALRIIGRYRGGSSADHEHYPRIQHQLT